MFSATDRFDPAAKVRAELRGPAGERIEIESGKKVRFQTFSRGAWRLCVTAEDAAANKSAPVEMPFDVSDSAPFVEEAALQVALLFTPSDTTGRVVIPESLLSFKSGGELPRIDFRIDTGDFVTFAEPLLVGPLVGARGDTGPGFGPHAVTYRVFGSDSEADTEIRNDFVVSPALFVEKSISRAPRVLLWWNGDVDPELEAAIAARAILFDTAAAKEEFHAKLRANRHNLFLIVGDRENLEPEAAKELAEHVFSGAGLISTFPDIWGPGNGRSELSGNLFGTRATGLVRKDLNIELPEILGETPPLAIAVDRIAKVDTTTGNVLAWAIPADTEDLDRYPAVIQARYGLGTTLYLAFEGAGAILENALRLVEPTSDFEVPGGLSASELRIRSLVVPVELAVQIDDILPSDLEVLSLVGPARMSGGSLSWTLILLPGIDTTVGHVTRLPDAEGMIVTEAVVSYLVRGQYYDFGRFPLTIRLAGLDEEFEALIEEIDALSSSVDRPERSRVERAVRSLEDAKAAARQLGGRSSAIWNTLDAIEQVALLSSLADETKTSLRVRLDMILRHLEVAP